MIIVISPAKTLDFETQYDLKDISQPEFVSQANTLARELRNYSSANLQALMSISEKLGELNHGRFQNWQEAPGQEQTQAAVLAFKGDVYVGLEAENFTEEDFTFAQEHLRILSGMYGLLRPLDRIQAYRLEMGTNLPIEGKKNLYKFWDGQITEALNSLLKQQKEAVLINLASNEYFKSVQSKEIFGKIITPVFKELRGDTYKVISFNAKKARGMMSAYIIKNKINNIEQIKLFDVQGYHYDEKLSSDEEWVFVKG